MWIDLNINTFPELKNHNFNRWFVCESVCLFGVIPKQIKANSTNLVYDM